MVFSHLTVVVADDDPFEAGDDFCDGGLMDGMWEVGVASGGAFEQHDKAMGEPVAEAFGAVIDAPGEVEDAWDPFGKVLDDVPDVSDVCCSAGVLELEKGDVFGAGGHEGIVSET